MIVDCRSLKGNSEKKDVKASRELMFLSSLCLYASRKEVSTFENQFFKNLLIRITEVCKYEKINSSQISLVQLHFS